MAEQLRFDISAIDRASEAFIKLAAELAAFKAQLDSLDRASYTAEANVDIDKALTKIKEAQEAGRKFAESSPTATLDANNEPLKAKVYESLAEADKVSRVKAIAKLDADATALHAQIDKVKAELDAIRNKTVRIDGDDSDLERKLANLESRLAAIDRRRTKIEFDSSSVDKAADSAARFGKEMDNAGRSTGSSNAILQRWVNIAQIAAVAAPLIAAGLAALPGVLAAAVVPLAAIALGIEGIKTAASQLAPAFDQIKESVSSAFERGLQPAVASVSAMMPTLQAGLTGTATALSTMANQMAAVVASVPGLAALQGVFSGINNFIALLAPGMAQFTQNVLNLTSAGAQGMQTFAIQFNEVAVAWKHVVDAMVSSGTAQAAVSGLMSVIAALLGLLAPLVQLGTELMAVLGPPLAAAINVLTAALQPLVSLIGMIPEPIMSLALALGIAAGAMRLMGGSSKTAADGVKQAAQSADDAGKKLTGMASAVDKARNAIDTASSAFVTGFISGGTAAQAFGEKVQSASTRAATALSGTLVAAVNRAAEAFQVLPRAVEAGGAAFSSGLQAMASRAASVLNDIPAAVERVGDRVFNGLSRMAVAANAAGDALVSGIGRGVAGIESGMNRMASAVVAGTKALETGFSNAISAVGRGVASMESGFGRVADAAGRGMRAAEEAVVSAGHGIASAVGTLESAFFRIPAAVTSAASSVRSAFAAIPAAIAAGTATAAGHLRAFGESIRSGLVTALERIPAVMNNAITGLTRFGAAAAAVGVGGLSALARGASGLLATLGGPWGAAIAAASVALSLLGAHQQEAAQAAAAHQSALEALRGTLETYSGAVTQNTVQEKANQLAKDGTLAKVRELGISVADYTQATLGNADALARVNTQLTAHTRSLIENSSAYKDNREQLAQMNVTIDDLTAAANGSEPALKKIKDGLLNIADPHTREQFKGIVDQMIAAAGSSAELARQLGITNGELQKIQDQQKLAAQAANDFGQKLDFVKQGLGGLAAGAPQTELLTKAFAGLSESANTAAQAAGETAKALGGVEAGGAAAAKSMQASRDAFIAAAEGAGLTKTQASALADAIGLIPAVTKLNFESNASKTTAELNTLREQIKEIPAGKSITVNAITQEAEAKLKDMGFKVEHMKNGQVTITAQTDAAKKKLDDYLAAANAGVGTVTLDANPNPATGKLAGTVALADGSTGTITLDAHPDPATGKINGVVKFADGSTGTITVDAHPDPATGKINATVTYGNGQTATVQVTADTAAAIGALNAIPRHIDVFVDVHTSGAATTGATGGAVIGGTIRRAEGGPIPGYPTGGPIIGPGSGTSDSIMAMLSNGEHVLTAAEVAAAGGHSAIYALRQSLLQGSGTGAGQSLQAQLQAQLGGGALADRIKAAIMEAIQPALAAANSGGGSAQQMMATQLAGLEEQLNKLNTMVERRGLASSIQVIDQSGDPIQTARQTLLALRLS